MPAAQQIVTDLDPSQARANLVGAPAPLPHRAHLIPFANHPLRKSRMVAAKTLAITILHEFEQAQMDLIGKAVALSDGKAGTVEQVFLDELHGLRIAIRGHDGRWPVSTIKFAQP